jgi:hypothetical protein
MTTTAIPPRKKKAILRRPLVWVILGILFLIIVIAIGMAGGEKPTPTAATSSSSSAVLAPEPGAPTVDPDPLSDGDWTASDIQVNQSQFGDSITALVTNSANTTRSGLFTLIVYDQLGVRIGTATGAASDVEPGTASIVTFVSAERAIGGDPSTWTYILQSDL